MAHASKWASSIPLGWHVWRQNNSERRPLGWRSMHLTTPIMWRSACCQKTDSWAPTTCFFFPSCFLSLLLEKYANHCKKKNKRSMVICLLSSIRSSFFLLQCIWSWIIYWIFFSISSLDIWCLYHIWSSFFLLQWFGLESFIELIFFFNFIS